MNDTVGLFNDLQIQLGETFGQAFNIVRPNYGQVDNTPALIGTINAKVEKTTIKLAQPATANMDGYAVFGNRALFVPGDILIPTQANSSTPAVTILSYSDGEECVSVRTSRVGKISTDVTNASKDIYTNVYYDWVGQGFTFPPNYESLEGALNRTTKRVMLWTRTNIQQQNSVRDVQGLHFVETDGTEPVYWTVKLVDQWSLATGTGGGFTIFTLGNE